MAKSVLSIHPPPLQNIPRSATVTICNSKYIQLLKFPSMFCPSFLTVFLSFTQKMTSWRHYLTQNYNRVFRRELAIGRFQTTVPSSGVQAITGKCLLGMLPSRKDLVLSRIILALTR